MLVLVLALSLGLAAEAEALSLPADPRLDPVRDKIGERVARARAAGLPADAIVTKVREGLAKGVDAARIEQAAGRLADSLERAQRFVAERRGGTAPAGLVRAVATAGIAGVTVTDLGALIADARSDEAAARAVEVTADLATRGYPVTRAVQVVGQVQTRDPGSLDRVPSTLDAIRQEQSLTHAETVDALARGFAAAGSLKAAARRTTDDARRNQPRVRPPVGPEAREGPGKSGFPPVRIQVKPPKAGKP